MQNSSMPIQINSDLPILVTDLSGNLIFATDTLCELVEILAENLPLSELQLKLPSEINKVINQFIENNSNQNDNPRNSYRISIERNNNPIFIELTSLFITRSEQTYLTILFRDLTYEIETELHLDLSEVRFRTIVENISDVAVTWMSTPGVTEMLYVNKGYENIWGRTVKSLYANPKSFIDLIHPEDKAQVIQHLEEHSNGNWNIDYRIIRDDGELRYIHDTGKGVYNNRNELEYLVGTAVDVTAQVSRRLDIEQYVRKLEKYSLHDELTSAFNRRAILATLEQALINYKRYGHDSALIFIDVNKLKTINDTYGHSIGDYVLVEICNYIKSRLRLTDSLGRYGGDEFIINLNETSKLDVHKIMQDDYGNTINISCNNINLEVTYDYGVTLASEHNIDTVDDWIKSSDRQMYQMKKNTEIVN